MSVFNEQYYIALKLEPVMQVHWLPNKDILEHTVSNITCFNNSIITTQKHDSDTVCYNVICHHLHAGTLKQTVLRWRG